MLLRIILFFVVIAGISGCIYAQSRDLRSYKQRGDEEFRRKNYKQALGYLEKWVDVNPRDNEAYVLIARSYARLGQKEKAFDALKLAVETGFTNLIMLTGDPDFIEIRGMRNFDAEIIAVARKNLEAAGEFPYMFAPQTRIGRYRVLYPPNYDTAKKYHLVLLLHGNSQEPGIMLRWAKNLGLEDVIFVSPEGTYVKLRESIIGNAFRFSAAGEDQNFPDSMKAEVVNYSAEWYNAALESARASLPVRNTLPIIVGFSQGGFYASVVATRYPKNYSSLVVICGSFFPEGQIQPRLQNLRKYGIDMLLLHATDDDYVPYQTAVLYSNLLKEHEVQHEFYSFLGGHWPSADATRKVADWIREHFAKQ